MAASPSSWKPVYQVVRRIPEGLVASYGQVAALAGMPGAARQVGWALNALKEENDVPWQRVINAQGRISSRGLREIEDLQRALLESEGVEFGANGCVDLARFAWHPRSPASDKAALTHKMTTQYKAKTVRASTASKVRARNT